ncbi:MAG: hypothetical protein WA809_03080 [Candidatus Dormiibacterota bacterium]
MAVVTSNLAGGGTKTVYTLANGGTITAWLAEPGGTEAQANRNAESEGMPGADAAPTPSAAVVPAGTVEQYAAVDLCLEGPCAVERQEIEGDWEYNGTDAYKVWNEQNDSCAFPVYQCSLISAVVTDGSGTGAMTWYAAWQLDWECALPEIGSCVENDKETLTILLKGSGAHSYGYTYNYD